jgi:hypothetical protein
VDSQTHDSPIGHHLLQFLRMSETEMVISMPKYDQEYVV